MKVLFLSQSETGLFTLTTQQEKGLWKHGVKNQMIKTEPTTRSDIFAALVTLNNLLKPMELVVDFKHLEERCRLCNQLISIENEKLPLDDGVCYHCMFGPTGDPEEHEDR